MQCSGVSPQISHIIFSCKPASLFYPLSSLSFSLSFILPPSLPPSLHLITRTRQPPPTQLHNSSQIFTKQTTPISTFTSPLHLHYISASSPSSTPSTAPSSTFFLHQEQLHHHLFTIPLGVVSPKVYEDNLHSSV